MVISSVENLQGQVLNHINLGQYIASKVPSLKVFKNEESRNGEGNSTLKNLCDVFLLLQRYEFKVNQKEWLTQSSLFWEMVYQADACSSKKPSEG